MSKADPFITIPVIGLCGYARSGKDTAAKGLIESGWARIAFADALKADIERLISGSLHHVDRSYPAGSFSLAQSGVKETLRPLLVEYGRAMRLLDPGHWIKHAGLEACVASLTGPHQGIVITDVRYPNEADWIRSLGGAVIRVVRPCPIQARPFGFIPSVRRRYPGAFPANAEEARTVPFVECDAEIINDSSEGLLMQRAFETALRLVPKRDQENNTNDTPCP